MIKVEDVTSDLRGFVFRWCDNICKSLFGNIHQEYLKFIKKFILHLARFLRMGFS